MHDHHNFSLKWPGYANKKGRAISDLQKNYSKLTTFLKMSEWIEVLVGKMTRGKETATLITNPSFRKSKRWHLKRLYVIFWT